MKILILVFFLPLTSGIYSQSLIPHVVTPAGGYFESGTTSVSWTLGEPLTEAFTNNNRILTQGFQQPLYGITITGISLDLLVFLEGPFHNNEMTTTLNNSGLIPLAQPFNTPPWNYDGAENVLFIPNPDVVDWVLVEIRDASNPGSATEATRLARQAGFLLKDGSVVGIDGFSILHFNNSFSQHLFVVVWHRNHLGIMSSNGILKSEDIYNWDFSVSESQVYGGNAGYNSIGSGVWGMVAGDASSDGVIDLYDKTTWTAYAGKNGYFGADYNLDTQVNSVDKNDHWLINTIKTQQVPQ
jgi:hypothetical protein